MVLGWDKESWCDTKGLTVRLIFFESEGRRHVV